MGCQVVVFFRPWEKQGVMGNSMGEGGVTTEFVGPSSAFPESGKVAVLILGYCLKQAGKDKAFQAGKENQGNTNGTRESIQGVPCKQAGRTIKYITM